MGPWSERARDTLSNLAPGEYYTPVLQIRRTQLCCCVPAIPPASNRNSRATARAHIRPNRQRPLTTQLRPTNACAASEPLGLLSHCPQDCRTTTPTRTTTSDVLASDSLARTPASSTSSIVDVRSHQSAARNSVRQAAQADMHDHRRRTRAATAPCCNASSAACSVRHAL